jgi:hypothetical protein
MCEAINSPSLCVTIVAKLNSSMKSWRTLTSSTANALGTYILAIVTVCNALARTIEVPRTALAEAAKWSHAQPADVATEAPQGRFFALFG